MSILHLTLNFEDHMNAVVTFFHAVMNEYLEKRFVIIYINNMNSFK